MKIPLPNRNQEGIIGFQALLRKSGTEIAVLAGLYTIVGALALVVIMLARKLMKMHIKTNKKSIAGKKSRKLNKSNPHSESKDDQKIVSNKHIQDVRQFARKLAHLYSQTDDGIHKQKGEFKRRAPQPAESEHSQKIESVMSNFGKSGYDSETVNLTKKFRSHNILQKSSGDKYDAVRDLSGQNWESWEIATVLSMGVEEVNMVLGLAKNTSSTREQNTFFDRISDTFDSAGGQGNHSEIAEKLNVGEEEVKLALKLQKGRSKAI